MVSSELVLAGFRLNYHSKDHHIDVVEIELVPVGVSPPEPNLVHFMVKRRCQDKNADGSYDGYVDVVAMAEVKGEGPVLAK